MSSYEIDIAGVTFGADYLPMDTPRAGRPPLLSIASSRTRSEPIWNPAGLQADALKAAERLAYELAASQPDTIKRTRADRIADSEARRRALAPVTVGTRVRLKDDHVTVGVVAKSRQAFGGQTDYEILVRLDLSRPGTQLRRYRRQQVEAIPS